MSIHPRFKNAYRVEVIPGEGAYLLSESDQLVLTDPLQVRLAPLLDGALSIEQIMETLADEISPQEIFGALMGLRSRGLLTDQVGPDGEHAAFDEIFDDDGARVRERLQAGAVQVTALGGLDASPLIDGLRSLGLRLAEDGLHVVLNEDELRPELDGINGEALSRQRPWLLVKPTGRNPWLGPLFVPGRTGCWQCLAHRRRGFRKVESFLRAHQDLPSPIPLPRAGLPTGQATVLNLAATEIYKWLIRGEISTLEGHVVTLDTANLGLRGHRLVRRPQCPACGRPDRIDTGPRPLELQSRVKSFTADGGHRSATPEEVFDRLAHHISPVTGIVGSLDLGMRGDPSSLISPSSYVADYGSPAACRDVAGLQEALALRAGGKGRTHAQARMSALGEAIERYSGAFQGDEPRIRSDFGSLGELAVHPDACQHFSRRQTDGRGATNKTCSRSTWVAEPFDETLNIEWSPVTSLTHGGVRYVPTSYAFYDHVDPSGVDFARANSNGCAAGSNKEEAILQGFFEVVERDAVAIWWYNRLRCPGVDLDSFDSAYIRDLQAHYRALNRELWCLDVSSDLEIPVFAAVSRRIDKPAEDLIFGFGAHLDPSTALVRALTEVNQSLPPVARVTANGEGYVGVNKKAISWWKTARLEDHAYLAPAETPQRALSDHHDGSGPDLRDDVMTCVRRVRDKGLETLVLDQTRPDAGLDVVKVIVPGLRHFWPRFAPGRLFDVPVRMGRMAEPLDEDELNRAEVYF